jgi:hypothetical protein
MRHVCPRYWFSVRRNIRYDGKEQGNTMRRRMIFALTLGLGAAIAARFWRTSRQVPPQLPPLPAPKGPLKTYHLGHSLVGRDMPAMLAQLAGHEYHSQLGWSKALPRKTTTPPIAPRARLWKVAPMTP